MISLGVTNLSGSSLAEIASKTKKLGFSSLGLYWGQLEDFGLTEKTLISELNKNFLENGIKIAELGVYISIIDRDKEKRKANLERIKKVMSISKEVGSPAVVTGSGSFNPNGDWFGHKENYSWSSWSILIDSLKELAEVGEKLGVPLGLEPHTNTLLASAERLRLAISEVGSRFIGVHLDPVNLVTYSVYFQTGKFLNYLFDVLGPYIMGAHAKDALLEDKLIVHMNETPAGVGNLDYEVYLKRLDGLGRPVDLIIEHTPEEMIADAKKFILEKANKVKVKLT